MQRNDQWVGGAILIAIGLAFLAGQYVEDAGRFIVLAIGLGLLVVFAVTRNPGALIGGGIVSGVGVGVLGASVTDGDVAGAIVLFSIGGGFAFVWLVGTLLRFEETRLWPLIPAAILILIGAAVLAGPETSSAVEDLWPVGLIALGIIVLLAGMRRRPSIGGPGAGGPGQAG